MDATPPIPTRSGPMTGAHEAGVEAAGDRDRPTRAWLVSWPVLATLFCVPSILWAFASPLFSAPDEPSHAVKAVALWHGQLGGADEMRPNGYLTTTYQIPLVWAQASPLRECFAFRPEVPADCAPPFAGSTAIGRVDSTSGHYPPFFFALVGWGGRLSDGPAGLHLMRITNAVACGLLLAVGVRALARIVDPRWALVGVLVALTPMAAFLAGSVNPNGLEIAAAIATWCTLLALLRWGDRHDDPLPAALVAQFAVAASVIAAVRPLSPLFLGAIGLLALGSVPLASVRRVLRDRRVLVALAVVAVVAVVATATIVSSDIFAQVPGRIGVGSTNPALAILGETDGYVAEMIGVLGWLDTPVPAFTSYAWLAATFGLVALALAFAPRRSALVLLVTVAATVVLPVAAQYRGAPTQGLAWQGRYTLPIAVGIPLLAVVALDGRRAVRAITPRVTATVAVLTASASLAAFYWALRRYTTGATGSLRITAGAWQPPGGSLLLLLAMAAIAAASVAAVVLARPGRGTADRSTDDRWSDGGDDATSADLAAG